MPYVLFTPKAENHLQQLFEESGADEFLLDRIQDRFQDIASNPASGTEPAKFPHPPNRLMANFILSDVAGRRWGFTATLRRTADEDGIQILTINGAPYSDDE